MSFVVNCSMLLTDVPVLQRPQAARDYRGNVALEYRADGPDPFGWLSRSERTNSPE